ncbi:MAG: hypothetical protein KGO81_03520 [Bacteroidota bacterium]|nr:hypothetical protein [Bacteroidota bacterium]
MKPFCLFIFFTTIYCSGYCQSSGKALSIHSHFPSVLHPNQQKQLVVEIEHRLHDETTGNITFELFNYQTHTSVDGWFLNIFPFQYFTATPGQKFKTNFPFTVPGNFTGKVQLIIKATCGAFKDSVSQIIPVK